MSETTDRVVSILYGGQGPDRTKKITKDYIKGLFDAQDYFDYLDYPAIEDLTGLTVDTIKQYRYSGKFPQPDNQFGQSPVWLRAHVEEWMVTSGRLARIDKETASALEVEERSADISLP